MLVDANLLLYAVDETSPKHTPAAEWLTAALNGSRRVALPWQSIGAFVRISTHPRIAASPLTGPMAWSFVSDWLASPVAWLPPVSPRTAMILGELIGRHGLTGNAIPDAQLAALAIEHGLAVCSADSDFARFAEVRWVNPLA
ncbi:MAG: TA system VapC family ribonuclease toxin [Nocardioides sp.]